MIKTISVLIRCIIQSIFSISSTVDSTECRTSHTSSPFARFYRFAAQSRALGHCKITGSPAGPICVTRGHSEMDYETNNYILPIVCKVKRQILLAEKIRYP